MIFEKIKKRFDINFYQIYLSCVLLVSVTIPFPIKYNNLAIIFLAFVWVIGITKRKFNFNGFLSNPLNILLWLIFTFHLLGLTYSSHIHDGLKKVERLAPFFAFPLLLYPLKNIQYKYSKSILNAFVIACFIATLIALSGALFKTIDSESFFTYNPTTKVNEYHFFYHQLGSHIGLHAVYFSIYIALSHLATLHKVLFKFSSYKLHIKIFLLSLSIYLPIVLYLLNSVTITFAWVFGLVIQVLLYVRKTNLFVRRKILIIPFILLLISTLFVGYKTFNEKIDVKQIGRFEYSDDIYSRNWGTLNTRLAKWSCAYEVLLENFWLGSGTGSETYILFDKYEEKGFILGIKKEFNPHNQFLTFGITLGVFSIILFILLLSWLFYLAIKQKNYIFLSFIIMFTLFSLTESTLATNKGIIFFVFFSLYFTHTTQCQTKKI